MSRDLIYDRIIEQPLERTLCRRQLAASVRRPRPGDSLATLLLGTLALGIGAVTLGATLAGIAGVRLGPWNEPYEVLTEAIPRQYVYVWDSDLGRMSSKVKMVT